MSGKSLSEIAETYRASLPPGEFMEFEVTSLDHLDVPVWSTALWPENGGPFCNGVGYGSTPEEARTSAYGECVESTFAWQAMRNASTTRASYEDLVSTYGAASVMDPITGCLPAGSDYTPHMPLEWVEARRHPGGEGIMVPVEFIATRGADLGSPDRSLLFTPVTNGLGAGMGVEGALEHAVLELLQRDGNGVAFRALDRGVVVELDTVEDAATRDILEKLGSEGVEVAVKLAATDFGFANLYVVGRDRDGSRAAFPMAASACGEAAHPDREGALRKALSEFCAARVRKTFNHGPLEPIRKISPPGYVERFRASPLGSEEDRSLDAMLDWLSLSHAEMTDLLSDTNFSERERVPFSSLPEKSAPDGEGSLLDLVVERLGNEGFEVLYADFFPEPDGEVRAVKAVSPGLEVETMSYGRIGARNLGRLLERDIGLVGLGEPPTNERPEARRILLTDEEEERFGGPAWFDYAEAGRVVGRLYPMYREPGRHVAALAAEERGVYR